MKLASVGFALAAGALVWAAPRPAHAYPTSVVFAPTGESLSFGAFATGAYAGLAAFPAVGFGGAWGGLNVGLVPSIEFATTSAGKIAGAGAEVGFDIFGPDEKGEALLVFNAKIQLLAEGTYWPALAIGFFQLTPTPNRGASLGYFALTKSFTISGVELGQLTFGLMRSFADRTLVAPQCFVSGAPTCLFRGSPPFEDENGGLIAGYQSPWLGPITFSIDHLGGTSAVSSTNLLINVRFWEDGVGGFASIGVGGFISNDRRDTSLLQDGVFTTFYFSSSLLGLFGWDPLKEPPRDPNKPRPQRRPRDIEELMDAPPLVPPVPTAP